MVFYLATTALREEPQSAVNGRDPLRCSNKYGQWSCVN
jgi:hypothetical protein